MSTTERRDLPAVITALAVIVMLMVSGIAGASTGGWNPNTGDSDLTGLTEGQEYGWDFTARQPISQIVLMSQCGHQTVWTGEPTTSASGVFTLANLDCGGVRSVNTTPDRVEITLTLSDPPEPAEEEPNGFTTPPQPGENPGSGEDTQYSSRATTEREIFKGRAKMRPVVSRSLPTVETGERYRIRSFSGVEYRVVDSSDGSECLPWGRGARRIYGCESDTLRLEVRPSTDWRLWVTKLK